MTIPPADETAEGGVCKKSFLHTPPFVRYYFFVIR